MRSWLSVLITDAESKKVFDIPIAPSLYSLSNKMDNSLLAVRDINHKYIVVERGNKMKAILSADRKWGLGYQGRLLVSIPSDLRFFRETTMGHVVVMGRKTLATLPAGQPLKGRTNIILSRDPEWTVRGATVVHSIKELMEVLKPYEDDDIYVAGGGEIYRQLLPYCDTAYVTRIDMTYQADTFFEDLDESPDWEMVEEGDEQTCFDIEFYFTEYRRKNEKAERPR